VTFRDLMSHFGNAEAALEALPSLSRQGGRTIRICSRDEAEDELARVERGGAHILLAIEPAFPAALATLEPPPPLLYAKGDLSLLKKPMVAIVGSRQCSAAGSKLARQFAADLGRADFVIASGLARGIDAAAHEAALEYGTVAVVAGGLDMVYPPENADLQDRIAAEGCIISERPLGFAARAQDFPRRNRIISGVSLGVVIVEAAHRSGSLTTARLAAEQGREVFAVPGHPLDPRAEGTNKLLKSGATLVTEAEDVLAALEPMLGERTPRMPPPNLREEPRGAVEAEFTPGPQLAANDLERVLAALGPAPIDVDSLVRGTGLTIRAIQVALIELSLAGRIERHGNGLVSLLPANK
jgi:DNA processing protein